MLWYIVLGYELKIFCSQHLLTIAMPKQSKYHYNDPVRVAIILLNVYSMNHPSTSNIAPGVPTFLLSSSSATSFTTKITVNYVWQFWPSWLAQLAECETVNLKVVGSFPHWEMVHHNRLILFYRVILPITVTYSVALTWFSKDFNTFGLLFLSIPTLRGGWLSQINFIF